MDDPKRANQRLLMRAALRVLAMVTMPALGSLARLSRTRATAELVEEHCLQGPDLEQGPDLHLAVLNSN